MRLKPKILKSKNSSEKKHFAGFPLQRIKQRGIEGGHFAGC
jgi:hypothetical protein